MIVRAATNDDVAALLRIYAPHVTGGAASFETEVPTPDEMRARLAGHGGLYPWLVADDDGAVAGYAYAGRFRERAAYRWAVETGAYVADDWRSRGIGRLLYAALLATLERQGFARAVASITLPNAASVALHEACGFRAAGVYRGVGFKLGRWRDVGLWQRDLLPADAAPEEPRRFADVGVGPTG